MLCSIKALIVTVLPDKVNKFVTKNKKEQQKRVLDF